MVARKSDRVPDGIVEWRGSDHSRGDGATVEEAAWETLNRESQGVYEMACFDCIHLPELLHAALFTSWQLTPRAAAIMQVCNRLAKVKELGVAGLRVLRDEGTAPARHLDGDAARQS